MQLIEGGSSIDDRGTVSFVNDFDFKDVKRFYMVENHEKGFIRAWHGHRKETKYVYIVSGSVIVAYFPIETSQEPYRVVLSAEKPQILCIPAGNYNGFKTLTDNARLMFFSTSTLEESSKDDIRLPATYFKNTWRIEQR